MHAKPVGHTPSGPAPFMLQELLGLQPDAFERRRYVVRPCLPAFVRHLELQGLRVGEARVDPRFDGSEKGISVHTERLEGDLEVIVTDDSGA